MIRSIAVMRRRSDSYVNATQILKVAGVDKGRRTKILEKEILPGKHEIVQGGYGKYQGTWSVVSLWLVTRPKNGASTRSVPNALSRVAPADNHLIRTGLFIRRVWRSLFWRSAPAWRTPSRTRREVTLSLPISGTRALPVISVVRMSLANNEQDPS